MDPSHPYRAIVTPLRAWPSQRRRALAAIAVAAGTLAVLSRFDTRAPGISLIPAEGASAMWVVRVGDDDLPPAMPLAPMLAVDGPANAALLLPAEGTTRVLGGHSLAVVFNRLMVPTERLGSDAGGAIRFVPSLRGSARWQSRSSLVFVPDATVWAHSTEAAMEVDASLRTLAGESVATEGLRRVVFDGEARVDPSATPPRAAVGASVRIETTGAVAPAALARDMFVFEGGAGRRIPFSLTAAGPGDDGRARFDLRPLRPLDPGAELGVAFAPSRWLWMTGALEVPALHVRFDPPPHIEGVRCPADPTDGGVWFECASGPVPGSVVDIEDVLRLRSSTTLATEPPSVTVLPTPQGLRVRTAGRSLEVVAEWAPDQVYEVRFGDVHCADGARLRPFGALAVRSRGLPPAVQVREGLVTVERDAPGLVPVQGVHVDAGAVWARDLAGTEMAAAAAGGVNRAATDETGRWERIGLASALPSSRANRWAAGSFRWSTDDGAPRARLLQWTPDAGDADATVSSSFVQRTDVAIHAEGLRGGVVAWVTSLQHATPLRGATVTLRDADGHVRSASTDASGLVWFGRAQGDGDRERFALSAVFGGDRSALVLDPRRAMHPGGLGLDEATPAEARSAADLVASTWLDRGVARPGETVHAMAVLRRSRHGALRALRAVPLTFRLDGPDGEVSLATVRTSAFGAAACELRVPPTARPGSFTVGVRRRATDPTPLATATLRVAEYRAPRVRAEVVVDRTTALDGEGVQARTSAALLVGAPLRDAAVRWSITRVGGAEAPPATAGFSFGLAEAPASLPLAATARDVTGADGGVTRGFVLHSAYPQRERLRVEAAVRDDSGAETVAARELTLLPADAEVGIETLPGWVAPGALVDPSVIVVRPDGSRITGAAVRVSVYREGWRAWWERPTARDGSPAAYVARRTQQRFEVQACALRSGTAPMRCPWRADRAGNYIVTAESADARGRISVATQRLYVAAPGAPADRDPPGAPITLTPERATVVVGETARIALENPWTDAEALVTVVRDGVLRAERRRLQPGGNIVEVPTTAEMAPNAFVTVAVVRPRTGSAAPRTDVDLDAPDLRWGATELTVRPAMEALSVLVEAPARGEGGAVPGEATVRVRDARGAAVVAEVSVWAVDEGTLRLSAYDVPSPIAGMFHRSAPAFALEDVRRSLLGRVAPLALPSASGDGPEGASLLRDERDRFDPTPIWRTALRTDEHGDVAVPLSLPDRAATYRLFAVAYDAGGRGGSSARGIAVAKDLVLEIQAPRAAYEGDRFEAMAVLRNTSAVPRDATVVATRGDAEVLRRTEHVEAGGVLRVPVLLEARAGRLQLDAIARSGTAAATARAVTTVLPATRSVRTLRTGTLAAGGILEVRDDAPGSGARTVVTFSDAPLAGLGSMVARLLEGDDGVEGSAAGLRGLAAALRAELPGIDVDPGAGTLRARAEAAVTAVLMQQTSLGGFGAWDADTESTDATLAAADALVEASRTGLRVPADALARTLDRLEALSRAAEPAEQPVLSLDGRAAAARILRAAGRSAPDIDGLFERRELLSPRARASLALAMAPRDLRARTLMETAARHLEPTPRTAHAPRAGDPADLPLAALLLRAFVVHDPSRVPHLAALLARLRDGDGDPLAISADDMASAAVALADAVASLPRGRSLDVGASIDGARLAPAPEGPHGVRFTLPDRAAVRVLVRSATPLYWALERTADVPLGPRDAVARGRAAALHRVLEDASGQPLGDDAAVHVGDLVRVRLFVFSERTTLAWTALRDPVGGGFEPVDPDVATSPAAAVNALVGAGPDDDFSDARVFHAQRSVGQILRRALRPQGVVFRLAEGSGLREFTFAVRATTAGTFVLPPASLESRSDASFTARSTTLRLRVVR